MSVPTFIKTEWKSRGCASLKFMNLHCKSCEKEKDSTVLSKNNDILDCSHTIHIECNVSTLNVWEYEEKLANLEEELQPYAQPFQQTLINGTHYDEPLPPAVDEETWKMWLQYWAQWRDIFVNLSWAQRFKYLCSSETLKWFDDCCKNYPPIIQFVNFCSDIQLETEKNIIQLNHKPFTYQDFCDSERRKLLDELYEELSLKRHWVHFRIFLQSFHFEIQEELQDFFDSYGIEDDFPQISLDMIDYSRIAPNFSYDSQHDQLSSENSNQMCPSSLLHNTEIEKQPELEVINSSLGDENYFTELKPKEHNVSFGIPTLEPLPMEGSHRLKLAKDGENPSTLEVSGAEVPMSKSSPMNLPKDTKPKYSKTKKVSHNGIAWALSYVKSLNQETKKCQPVNESHTFDCQDATSKHSHSSNTEGSGFIPFPDVKTEPKKEHKEVEIENFPQDSLHELNESRLIEKSSNFFAQSITSILIRMKYFVLGFSGRIFTFMGAFASSLHIGTFWSTIFSFPVMWSHSKQHSILLDKRRLRNERNLLKLQKLFKLTIPKVDLPLSSSRNMYLSQVTKCADERSTKENLIKVTVVDDATQDIPVGLYVMYMSEEDIDDALEGMMEFIPFDGKELSHRTLTLFDDDGMPQHEVKVPVDDEKAAQPHCISMAETSSKDWFNSTVQFDDDGNPVMVSKAVKWSRESLHSKIQKMLQNYHLMRLSKNDIYSVPPEIHKDIVKYWRQRFRLFLRYDEGIRLDHESWFSVTPEMIASHQAERCACDTVIDAFCGAGGNAIQLAATCLSVIAIDLDPLKIELARHNAKIYGVEDRIQFIQGNFFLLAKQLKADVVFLAPPWGGIEYLHKNAYDVFLLGGKMDGKKLFEAAHSITQNIALYLPRNSNLLQIMELAGQDYNVDLEFNYISNKRKSLTAYFGDLVNFMDANKS